MSERAPGMSWSAFRWQLLAVLGAVAVFSVSGCDEAPSWSPDGKECAFVVFTAERNFAAVQFDIYVHSLEAGRSRRIASSNLALGPPAWSPKGDRIAFVEVLQGEEKGKVGGYRLSVMLYDLESGQTTESVKLASASATEIPDFREKAFVQGTAGVPEMVTDPLLWDPSGRYVARRSRDAGIVMLDTASGEIRAIAKWGIPLCWSPEEKGVSSLLWTPEQQSIDVTSSDGGRRRRLAGPDELGLGGLPEGPDEVSFLKGTAALCRPDNTIVFFTQWLGGNEKIKLFDPAKKSSSVIGEAENRRNSNVAMACTRQGDLVAYLAERREAEDDLEYQLIVRAMAGAPSPIYGFRRTEPYIGGLSWSPDGRWIALVLEAGELPLAGLLPGQTHTILLVSPDGKRTREIQTPASPLGGAAGQGQ